MFSLIKKFLASVMACVLLTQQLWQIIPLAADGDTGVYLYYKSDISSGTGEFGGDYEVTSNYLNLSGSWLKTLGDCTYSLAGSGLIGYTRLCFDFVPDGEGDNCISFAFSDKSNNDIERNLFEIDAKQIDLNNYDIYIGEIKVASVKSGECVQITADINTATGNVSLRLTDSVGRNFSAENKYDMKSLVLSKINFSGSEMYISDISVYRKNTTEHGKTVVYRCGNFYLAEGKCPSDDLDMYLGVFNKNILIKCEKSAVSSDNCMAFLYYPVTNDNVTARAFLWDKNLTPVCGAAFEPSDKNIVDSSVSGTLRASADEKNITVSCSADGGYVTYMQICDSEGNVVYSTKKDNLSGELFTAAHSGEYSIIAYAEFDNGYLAEYADTTVFVSPKSFGTDTMVFRPFKNYYIRNGEKIYYSKHGAENVTVSDDEVYMSAEQIRKVVGTDITGAKSITNSVRKLYSLNDVCTSIGYNSYISDGAIVLSDSGVPNTQSFTKMFDETIFSDSFEEQNYNSAKDNWFPKGWSFFDWYTGTHAASGFGKSEDFSSDGQKSIYIDSPAGGFCGYIRSDIDFPTDAYSYDVDIDIRLSDAKANIKPYIALQLYKGSTFVKMLSMHEISGNEFDESWRTAKFTLAGTEVRDYDFDKITVVVCASKKNGSLPSSGKAYYDNIRITTDRQTSNISAADFSAVNPGAMFTAGEPIVYNVKSDEISGYEYITAHLYDVGGLHVGDYTQSVFDTLKSGFVIPNPGVGYYEVEFEGIHSDGTVYPLASAYCVYSDTVKLYQVLRHSFAVFANDTKPMSERSEMFMLSDYGLSAKEIEIADKVGFSGIRLHTVNWGTNGARKGFHTSDGSFDWSLTDEQINNVSKYGFKNVVANICNTPKWAAPAGLDSTKTNIVGNYEYNVYAPTNMRYLTDAVSAYATRYKDKITAIEFWNEPYYGKTAFWHDGIDKFRDMSIAAYDAVKSVSEDIKVYNSGFFVSGSTFFDELMSNNDYRKKIDGLSFHGRYNFYKKFGSVLKKYNMTNLDVMDSEGYFYSKEKRGSKDESELNMYMTVTYLNEIKQGISKSAMFQIADSYTGDYYDDMNDMSYGLFKNVNGNYEPMRGACVLRNLIDIMPSKFEYFGEAKMSDQCAVVLSGGGKKYMLVWNNSDNDFSLSDYFRTSVTLDSRVIDFYGRQADLDNMKAKTVYIITNADTSAGYYEKTDSCLNNDYLYPHYTCKSVSASASAGRRYSETGVNALFDTDTFEVYDSAAVYTGRPRWCAGNTGVGTNTKFATSFTEKGLYITADITGDSEWVTADSTDSIDESDCIVIAADGYKNNLSAEQNVFCVSRVNGKDVIYKKHAAEIYAAQPTDFSPSGSVVSGGTVRITRSGNSLNYKIFIPESELYPMAYSADTSEIRLSVNAYDYSSSGYNGAACFGENLKTSNDIYRELSIFKLSGIGLKTECVGGKMRIYGDIFDESSRVGAIVYCNGKIFNVLQADCTDGEYVFEIPVNSKTKYDITVCTEKGSIVTKAVTTS